MDFENPFAEEEEPEVIPNEPLLDYDNGKKEEDFNALVVLSSKLEMSLSSEKKADVDARTAAERLHDALRQTVAQQRQVIKLRHAAAARAVSAQSNTAERGVTQQTMLAVMDDLNARLREHEVRSQKLEHSASLYAQKLSAVATQTRARQAEVEAEQTENRPMLLATVLDSRHGTDSSVSALTADLLPVDEERVLTLLDKVATRYTQRHPQEVANAHEAEEVALALAIANNTADALRVATAMDAQVREQVARLREGLTALQSFDDTRLRLARLLDRQRCQAAAGATGSSRTSADVVALTGITSANDSLGNEVRRLERALLSLTSRPDSIRGGDGDSSADEREPCGVSTAAVMALHVAALEEREAELTDEAIRLGREVLQLRRYFAHVTSAPLATLQPLHKKAKHEEGAPPAAENLTVRAMAQLSRALSTLIPSGAANEARGAAADALRSHETHPIADTLAAGVEAIAQIQRVCLEPLHTLNEELRKQASTAWLLRRLAVHGTDFRNPVVARVLEGCAAWPDGRAQEVQEMVSRACESMETHPEAAKEILQRVVHGATQSASACMQSSSERTRREQYYEALIRSAVEDPALQSALLAQQPAVNGVTPLPPFPPLTVSLDATALEQTMADEVAYAETQAREYVNESVALLHERLAELRKKQTWFDKQPYTAPLRELHALQLANDALAAQLADGDADKASHDDASQQVEALRQAIAAEESEANRMEARINELRRREEALSTEENAALSFLRE